MDYIEIIEINGEDYGIADKVARCEIRVVDVNKVGTYAIKAFRSTYKARTQGTIILSGVYAEIDRFEWPGDGTTEATYTFDIKDDDGDINSLRNVILTEVDSYKIYATVEIAVDTKLNRVDNQTGFTQLYGVDVNGNQQMIRAASSNQAIVKGRIPMYTDVGNGDINQEGKTLTVPVGNPQKAFDAANKFYVDEQVKGVKNNTHYEYESEELDDMFFGTILDSKKLINDWNTTSNNLYTFQATKGYYRVYATLKDPRTFGVIEIDHVDGMLSMRFDDNAPYVDVDVREATLNGMGTPFIHDNIASYNIYLYHGTEENPAEVPAFNAVSADRYKVMLNRKAPDGTVLDFHEIILTGYIRFNLDAENYVEDWFSYDFTRQCKGIPGGDHLGSFMIHGTFCSVQEKDCPVHTYSAKVTYSLHGNYEFRLHGIEYFRIDNSSAHNGVSCGVMKNIRCRTMLTSGVVQLCE